MYDLIIRDATIVTSKGRLVADVCVKDGRIAYVGPRPPRNRAKREISAIGKFLMPGVIDTAVQFDPNGDEMVWCHESRAAVTGGITTVVSLPGGDHPVVDEATARRRAKIAGKESWCNYALWARATRDNVDELHRAHESGFIVGALAYLGGDEGLPAAELSRFLGLPGVLGVQLAENELSADATEVLELAKRTDRPIHVVHLSTADELDLLDPVHGQLPVTAGVTPHHLFLSEEEIEEEILTRPPVRPEHDRRTLWTAVKRGRLDCVASDHHATGASTEGGVPGAELMFPLMLSAVKYGRLSLEMLVSLCSEQPARIFGLERKGRIERGADADLVLFSEGEIARVDGEELMSHAGWSPYADREAAPKPEYVIVNGQITAERGELVGIRPVGTLATRHLVEA